MPQSLNAQTFIPATDVSVLLPTNFAYYCPSTRRQQSDIFSDSNLVLKEQQQKYLYLQTVCKGKFDAERIFKCFFLNFKITIIGDLNNI